MEDELKKLQEQREATTDLPRFKELTSRIDKLKDGIAMATITEQREKALKSAYNGTLYKLFRNGEANPFYVGITDMAGRNGIPSEMARFEGHIRQCLDILKIPGADFCHLRMLGEIVTYAQRNGINKNDIKPSDFYDIFTCKQVVTGVADRESLEMLETQHIESENQKGSLLMNMKKNKQYGSRTGSSSRKRNPQANTEPVAPVLNTNQC